MTSDRDRQLFEQALADLDRASPSKLARIKTDTPTTSDSGARAARSRRLDKLRKSAQPEASIDLHGLDRKTAVAEVRSFIRANRRRELLLVVHGKGSGVLQQRVTQFLTEDSAVAEHVAAPQRLGGSGARLVRLRRLRK